MTSTKNSISKTITTTEERFPLKRNAPTPRVEAFFIARLLFRRVSTVGSRTQNRPFRRRAKRIGVETKLVGSSVNRSIHDDRLFVVAANRHRCRAAPVEIQTVPRPAKLQRPSDVFVSRADAIFLLATVDRDQIKITLIGGISHRCARVYDFVPLRNDVAPP